MDGSLPLNDVKLVWIASMPRSGSMWTFNVTRALLADKGFQVLPDKASQREADTVAQVKRGLADLSGERIWVLKTHSAVRAEVARSRIISTHRDLRDAMVSMMRFMHRDFETTFRAAAGMAELCDHFHALPEKISLALEYRDIVARPTEVVDRIARFLDLDLAPARRAALAARFTKKRVVRIINHAEADAARRSRAGAPVPAEEMIVNSDGSTRLFDPETGFQSGHVSDYEDGGWREILSAEQQRRIHDAYGDWLRRNGYPVYQI